MAKKKHPTTPPMSPAAHLNKLIALGYGQAEAELEAGTATSQIVTQFVLMGSPKYQEELAKLRLENELLKERIESERAARDLGAQFESVLNALKSYSMSVDDADL